jgi:chromosome condensin MukBEF ATPase and DNA-binding subunit MukB
LKLRQATHFNEKLHQIESQNKANKEELKRKEGQIIEMNNEIVKLNNENGKKMALVE